MSEIPDAMPEDGFDDSSANTLMDTIQGICNESTLPRISILGALEAVKYCLLEKWMKENEAED